MYQVESTDCMYVLLVLTEANYWLLQCRCNTRKF